MKSILWKKRSSKNGLLYVILDTKVTRPNNINIFSLADRLASSGVDIFQLRAKDFCDRDLINTAEKLSKIIHKRKKLFLINDRADIAYFCGADGLHLGSGDISPNQARKILGNKSIIGRTVHSLSELHKFSKEKIDYVSIGPVFKTKTKPNLLPLKIKQLQSLASRTQKLTFAIGGITLYNIGSLTQIGIKNIAICRGIILENDLKSTVKNFKKCLQKAS
jgi:thiamine-phosphate pyrophosphorylase